VCLANQDAASVIKTPSRLGLPEANQQEDHHSQQDNSQSYDELHPACTDGDALYHAYTV
jgi:hypothetical protein